MYGGYGMGYGMGGYGMGGPGIGTYLGLSLAEAFIREQQRQAFLQQQLRQAQQLGQDQAAIANLQQQLSEQNAKVESMRSQAQGQLPPGSASTMPQQAPGETEATMQLKMQLLEQQKEIEALRQAVAK